MFLLAAAVSYGADAQPDIVLREPETPSGVYHEIEFRCHAADVLVRYAITDHGWSPVTTLRVGRQVVPQGDLLRLVRLFTGRAIRSIGVNECPSNGRRGTTDLMIEFYPRPSSRSASGQTVPGDYLFFSVVHGRVVLPEDRVRPALR